MANSSRVAIRLGTEGKGEVKSDFAEVRQAGEKAFDGIGDSARQLSQEGSKEAERLASAYERAAERADKAMAMAADADRKRAAQAAKLAAIAPKTALQMQIEAASGSNGLGGIVERDLSRFSGFGQFEGSARASAAAIRELLAQEDALVAKANALKAILDPVTAAQNRFNAEMAELKAMAPHLTVEELAQAEARLKAQLDDTVSGHARATIATGAFRAGMQQAGFQVQDFFVQINGGTDAVRAFSMQAPQLIGSLQLMSDGADKGAGRFATFARILGGPWGVALGIAIPVAGMLAEKLLDQSEASKEAQKAAEEHKRAIDAVTQAMEKSIQTAEDKARSNFILIETERQLAIVTERNLQTALERAKADAEERRNNVKMTARGDVIDPGYVRATQEVERLQGELKKSQERLNQLTRSSTIAQGQYQATIVDQLMDPRGRVNRTYDNLRNQAIAEGKGAAAIAAIERSRDAELKKIEETNKALREGTNLRDGANATPSQVSKLLQEAFGGTITSTTGGKHVKGSYHYRGQAVDFVPAGGMNALSKEQIRTVIEGAGLTVKELLGPGDKGHSDHFHVAWSGGRYDSRMGKSPDELAAERSAALGKSIGIEGVGVMAAQEQAAIDAWTDAMKKAEEADKQRKERVAEMLGQGNDEVRLAQLELSYRGRVGMEEQKILELERYRLDLKRQYPDITDAELGSLVAQKAELLELNDLLDRQRAAWEELNQAGENMVDTVLDPQNFRDWGDAGKAILQELEAEIWKLIALNPIKNWLFGSSLPTLFGGSGGILGLLGGSSASALGKAIDIDGLRGLAAIEAGGAAIGTEYASGGATWLAENGPELVNLPRGSRVTPAAETRRLLSGSNDNRPNQVTVYANDAVLAETVKGWVQEAMAVAIEQGSTRGAALAAAEGRYSGSRSLEGK